MYFILSAIGVAFVGLVFIAKKLSPKRVGLDGGHVLVTGGSSGIGKAIAVESAKRGANVTILARNKLNLEKAQTEIQQYLAANRKVHSISTDLTSGFENVETAVRQAEDNFGPVLLLVNSAGSSISASFQDMKPQAFKELMEINYLSAVYATKAALPRMVEEQRGRVVFLSSQAGQLGLFGFTAYSGSKFALRGLAEALQMEVTPYNIRVTMAFPPDTDTPRYQNELKGKPKETILISETAGLLKAEDVALTILNDSLAGKFISYHGMDGWLLSVVTAGMAPATSLLETVTQFLLMGVARVVSLFFLTSFDRIVLKCKLERDAAKEKSD